MKPTAGVVALSLVLPLSALAQPCLVENGSFTEGGTGWSVTEPPEGRDRSATSPRVTFPEFGVDGAATLRLYSPDAVYRGSHGCLVAAVVCPESPPDGEWSLLVDADATWEYGVKPLTHRWSVYADSTLMGSIDMGGYRWSRSFEFPFPAGATSIRLCVRTLTVCAEGCLAVVHLDDFRFELREVPVRSATWSAIKSRFGE
jgi:hypothetical protein